MSSRSLGCRILIGVAAVASSMAFADDYRISGPYTHDNLSIFLIHSAAPKPSGKYLTLQEAMDQKKVVVYETGNVNELAIENTGPVDVYIQSGDIVKGGRQDRVFPTDYVLPSSSGKVPIASFCVEHGRWTKRGGEAADRFNASNQTLPSKSLKLAARNEGQQQVWDEVAKSQRKMAMGVSVKSEMGMVIPSASPTSMQLALENKEVSNATEAYVHGLAKIVDDKPDVVGYAFAINGKVNSADIYASNDMFVRMWSKLLRASAVEAMTERTPSKTFAPPDIPAVRSVLATAEHGKESEKPVANRLVEKTKDSGKVVLFETRDREADGAWIHRSYVVK